MPCKTDARRHSLDQTARRGCALLPLLTETTRRARALLLATFKCHLIQLPMTLFYKYETGGHGRNPRSHIHSAARLPRSAPAPEDSAARLLKLRLAHTKRLPPGCRSALTKTQSTAHKLLHNPTERLLFASPGSCSDHQVLQGEKIAGG